MKSFFELKVLPEIFKPPSPLFYLKFFPRLLPNFIILSRILQSSMVILLIFSIIILNVSDLYSFLKPYQKKKNLKI